MHKVFTLREAALLSATLPEGVLDGSGPVERGQVFAAHLAAARRSARGRLAHLDIEDPIEGPPELHDRVVGEIAGALSMVLAVLAPVPPADAPPAEQTLRIVRLPPVPPPRPRRGEPAEGTGFPVRPGRSGP
ncbi:hypothetical protein SAMN05661080_03321 [Modestobacter sp. DSM 44400]|uniref:hypothetical protein n=1 Tax=Modestobacter sp. DSM 44400 TaxID=1550230 RepID=UPI000897720C|nr:hypothetical protein [Modestobacter sp. DSM 44400]SDY39187.1 hypothetical protein SAMN05661080_03321 [Modestobacter sp. DSM 44400]